jgi:hypothetical protein
MSQIIFVDGAPGCGPCTFCGAMAETRFGGCFTCATEAERRAAHRSVVQHVGSSLAAASRGDWTGARIFLCWAWERLTKTGDYAPGGEFERQYFNPQPLGAPLTGPR